MAYTVLIPYDKTFEKSGTPSEEQWVRFFKHHIVASRVNFRRSSQTKSKAGRKVNVVVKRGKL